MSLARPLIDPFGRQITYLRLSVTDRCDLRCTYCMAEHMTFLPKRDLLTLEELDAVATAFIKLGVRKLRLTGGEPLVRKGFGTLARNLARHVGSGSLDELTLTTNATRLEHFAKDLSSMGVRRINVSLDTLDTDKYRQLTRGGSLDAAFRGIDAALAAGITIKINTVALKDTNVDELPTLIRWAHDRGMALSLIEAMPMGDIDEDRFDQYIPLTSVRQMLEESFTFHAATLRTGGPSRYFQLDETSGTLGLISPLSVGFCDGCNRVRVTCTGRLYLCLGQENSVDLRAILRSSDGDLATAITSALTQKPKGHDFSIEARGERPAVPRHMSVTGG